MSITLYWLQCGGCNGDSISLLNADSPDLPQLFNQSGIDLLWHPSLSGITPQEKQKLDKNLASGREKLDILCIEGSIILGPDGTGMFDSMAGTPKKDLAAALANKAGHVIAVGTCAAYGGIAAVGEVEATGLQFHQSEKGGFLGRDFKSAAGVPVINLPGCPCHYEIITGTLSALAAGVKMELDEFGRPVEWYGILVHQGCTRNEYHEYRVEEHEFGEKGCLFFYKGCHGPLAYGSCNKLLWNKRTSKTRVGVPCFGCTMPDFPQAYPFFQTRNIEGIPLDLPDGLNRAHYMAYKGMAAAAAPDRLKGRKTGI